MVDYFDLWWRLGWRQWSVWWLFRWLLVGLGDVGFPGGVNLIEEEREVSCLYYFMLQFISF